MNRALADAALDLVGVPFRLHGRDPATGLDCVGLVAEAVRRTGRTVAPPRGYRMRMLTVAPLLRFAEANGLEPTAADPDVILAQVHALQPHLLVVAPGGMVHAHAGLGRVTFLPDPLPWPIIAGWRAIPTILPTIPATRT
ncbi:C40 family peptidase [Novosphingobium lentum]|uniref:C40 family peptidase n=1 Tax=Novosphingobium lentum TaxID=145287 RepID=UPI000A908237|nr:C40 family peptidase [Novosphingobium lentum]